MISKFLIILFSLYSLNSFSSSEMISCSYNFGNNTEILKIKEYPFVKKWIKNKLRYKIYINSKEFSETEDYLTIQNNKNHKITYSLKCK